MYVERFVTKDWILPLKLIGGRKNPFGITLYRKKGIILPPNPPPLFPTVEERNAYTAQDISLAKRLISGIASTGYPGLPIILSKCIADGLKVFRPTFAEMVAMEGLEVDVPFAEYHQPYPAFIIELPEEYRKWIRDRNVVIDAPRYEMIWRPDFVDAFFFTTMFSRGNTIDGIFSHTEGCHTIEDAFRRSEHNNRDTLPDALRGEDDFKVANTLHRLSAIFSLFMVTHPTKKITSLDSQPKKRRRRRKGKEDHRVALLKKRMAEAGKAHLYDFNQKIRFYAFSEARSSNGEGREGPKKRPHVRRGHIRRQRYGPGLSQVKQVFIPHTIINLQYFTGDKSDLTALYLHLPKRSSKGRRREAEAAAP